MACPGDGFRILSALRSPRAGRLMTECPSSLAANAPVVATVTVPVMVSVMVPAAAVTVVTMSWGIIVEEEWFRRAVAPPVVPAVSVVVMVRAAMPVAPVPVVVEVVSAHLVEDPVEERRGQAMEEQLPVVARLVVPCAPVLALAAEGGLDADGEQHQHGCCRQSRSLHLLVSSSSRGALRPRCCRRFTDYPLRCRVEATVGAACNALMSACAFFGNRVLLTGAALRFVAETPSTARAGALHSRP